MRDTAILITTFLRDNYLYRCVDSIRKYYPDVTVFIGDNGEVNNEKREFCLKNYCKLFELPFDLGVSGVRNESIKLIPKKYKYIVVVEDDIIFTEGTKLEKWRRVLAKEEEIGIVGGLLKKSLLSEQHYEANTRIESDTHYIERIENPEWKKVGNIKYFLSDLVLNVFMMKRAVWDDCKWDNQFKTALEHSDFFLRIKYKTDWKVAYVPGVWMYHKKGLRESTRYKKYRSRPIGWKLFGKKWGVKYSVSSYNKINPISYESMFPDYNIKDENLELTIRILEKHECKWWLEAGTCLGAVRENNFISYDPDIDIGIEGKDIKLWNTFIKEFQGAGFKLYKEWKHNGKRIELSFKRKAVKLDLFFFFHRESFLWHGAFGPNEKGQWGKNMVFLPHVFSTSLFKELKEVVFRGKRCFIPNPPEQYLRERYGAGWKKPGKNYTYWKDCRAIDRNFFKKDKTVFIGGVWDLFHVGHLNILEKARGLGNKLVVGVLTDEAAARYKDRPTVGFEQRKRIIESLRLKLMTVKQNDTDPTKDLKRLGIKPHYIVHADDWSGCPGEQYVKSLGGKAVYFPYTKGISSTELKKRIRNIKPIRSQKGNKIAIGIKTFLRDQNLYKTLDAIENNFPYPYRLYIADDGGSMSDKKAYFYQQLEDKGHVILRLPFNSGISMGRNAIVRKAKEKYIMIMDDDILIKNSQSIINMKKVLDSHGDIGLCSGILRNESGDYLISESYQKGLLFEVKQDLLFRYPSIKRLNKVDEIYYIYADQVVNFFLAKSEIFNDVQWDDRIKVEWEHIDFFLGLKKTKWKAVVCLGSEAVHLSTIASPEYNQYRRSNSTFYFYQKNSINNVINRFN